MVNPFRYMLQNPKVSPNTLDNFLESRLFSYCKVTAGTAVVAGFAKLFSHAEGNSFGIFKVKEWFKPNGGKGSASEQN